MTLENFIEHYGYWALFIGTILEGETILIIAGFLAHQEYLNIQWVIFVAFSGTLLGDQFFFFLGRSKGRLLIERRKSWQKRTEKVQKLLIKYQDWVALGFRFVYGLRTITPFALGISNVKIKRFIILNIFSAALWAILIGLCGYMFGHIMESILKDIKQYEKEAIIAMLFIGGFIWIVKYYRNKKHNNLIINKKCHQQK